MHFLETPVFTRLVRKHLDDEAYGALQRALILRPELGAVMKGAGGIRKVRWAAEGRGKRGALRVIYFWEPARSTFYCLYLYPKNVQDNLSPAQLRLLRRLVEEEFG